MKRNVLQNVMEFILKYIWAFCALLIVAELFSTLFTGVTLMQQTTKGMVQSVCGEISGRVDGVLRLLQGISKDERFSDTDAPLFDRALLVRPYQQSYNLYMIAFTDEQVNVVASDDEKPPEKPFSLAYRDYMQQLYATGEYQITDAFKAGADGVTMNYTIAVPLMKDGVVKGSVFGSIYFNDIEGIIDRNTDGSNRRSYLLGKENTVMAGGSEEVLEKNYLEMAGERRLFGTSAEQLESSLRAGESGAHWEWGPDGLYYVAFQNVAPTEWTIVYQVQFWSAFTTLLPGMVIKSLFYVLICLAVYLLGRRYLRRRLASVDHLLNRVTALQQELFQSEQPDYENLLELTQQGLTDQLTGLSTRAVLVKRMTALMAEADARGAVLFIDLDDLKRINDHFGHEAGDCALLHFARTLKQMEENKNGIAARYGGDEFILILQDQEEEAVLKTAAELCADLNYTVTIKESSFQIHGSIGVAFFPEHGNNPGELIGKADLALYAAKQEGKNQFVVFTSEEELPV